MKNQRDEYRQQQEEKPGRVPVFLEYGNPSGNEQQYGKGVEADVVGHGFERCFHDPEAMLPRAAVVELLEAFSRRASDAAAGRA